MKDHLPSQPANQPTSQPTPSWPWIALALLAGILRLAGLAAAPLSLAEASEALPAYFAAHATVVQNNALLPADGYSPLLFHLNTLLFALFDGGDGLARLVPALTGVGLALTPLLLRRHLGRWGALGTGFLLAISPLTLLSSRTLDGTVPAALGIMLLLGCTVRFLDTGQPKMAIFGGLGLAIALTAGPAGWAMLVGLLLALGGVLWVWREEAEWAWPVVRPAFRWGAIAFGLGLLALGTGLGLNLMGGVPAIGTQLASYAARFAAASPSPSPLLLLAAYEPLIILAGLIGLLLVVIKRHRLGMLLAFWAAAGWIQVALMPGREPTDLLWMLLPLAGLGGLAVEELAQAIATGSSWANEGLHLPVSLVLWAHAGMTLARYARNGARADLVLAGMTLLLQVLLTAAFGFAVSVPEEEEKNIKTVQRGATAALRAGGISLGLILVTVTVAIGSRLAFVRPADPRELAVQNPAAVEVRTLVEVAEHISSLNKTSGERLPITFLGDADPALAWALRRFDLRVTETQWRDSPLVIASAQTPLPDGYFREFFTLQRTWTPTWGGNQTARWWLYRETTAPSVDKSVALWVHQSLATSQPNGEQ